MTVTAQKYILSETFAGREIDPDIVLQLITSLREAAIPYLPQEQLSQLDCMSAIIVGKVTCNEKK